MGRLQLVVIAALTPGDVTIEMYDDRMEPSRTSAPLTSSALPSRRSRQEAYEISARYRHAAPAWSLAACTRHSSPRSRSHATHPPGDAEGAWPRLIADFRDGRSSPVCDRGGQAPQPGCPCAATSSAARLPALSLVQFGRGCRYACDFCACSAYLRRAARGAIPRSGPRGRVPAGAQHPVHRRQHRGRPRAAAALVEQLAPLRIRWGAQASIDIARQPRLLARAAATAASGSRSASNLRWRGASRDEQAAQPRRRPGTLRRLRGSAMRG